MATVAMAWRALAADPFRGGGVECGGGAGIDRGLADHLAQLVLTAENFDGLGTPRLALLGKRSGLMFGLAGFQGGLLCQCDRFDVGGFASVVCLELLGQLGGAGFDGLAARGPASVEFGVDADDFADRALAPTGRRHLGELQSEALAKVCFQARVVQLGDG